MFYDYTQWLRPDCYSQYSQQLWERGPEKSVEFIHAPWIRGADGFICEIFDDCAFYAGTCQKTTFRLYEIAVISEKQNKGYGKAMIKRIMSVCQSKGIDRIMLRTSRKEEAVGFYVRLGGNVIGTNGDDWEVEIKV